MDFISKLSSKAGETFQNIKDSDQAKKAKNYAEIPGLQMQVGKYDSQIKKAYQEIGKLYFEANKDNDNADYGMQIQNIKFAMDKIEALKAEIEAKKKYDPSADKSGDVADEAETQEATVIPAVDVTETATEEEE